MVADVIKSFDTVDGSILDCEVYFSYHGQVQLRFKLAAGVGEPWCRDGGILQGCPLNMVFIVALYVPWCRRLEAMPDIKPELYADNLKSRCPLWCSWVRYSVCPVGWTGCRLEVCSAQHLQGGPGRA